MAYDEIKRPKWDMLAEIPSLVGKVAIVTGANSPKSIGYNTAKALALKGAKVYIGARSAEKAEYAIREMKQSETSLSNASLFPFVADLGDLKQVQEAARSFANSEERLDILVNNASLLARPLDKNKYGISVSFATNHLGPFVLTTQLLPLLEKTAKSNPGVRVVAVASTTHAMVPPGVKLSTVEDFNQELGGIDSMESNLTRYGLSKLANILFTKELQKRLDAKGINAITTSLHPGGVKTAGSIQFLGGQEDNPLLDAALSPEDGALTSIFAAAHPSVWAEKEKYGGGYLMPFGQLHDVSENAKNLQLAADLWKASEEAVSNIVV